MKVTVIASTRIEPHAMREVTDNRWDVEDFYDDSSTLSEFAGRACYQSWDRPNPATASNAGYLNNVIHQMHYSVLEHGSVTFHIAGVSRSLTHELVRHRHMSPSQLSQRFVVVGKGDGLQDPFVVPPLYEAEMGVGGMLPTRTEQILTMVWQRAVESYDELVAIHMPRLIQAGVDGHRARKMAREAARAVLPNMTPTAIVLTGNHRAWREFLDKRATIHADAEIRRLAMTIYEHMIERESNLYADYHVVTVEGHRTLERRHVNAHV